MTEPYRFAIEPMRPGAEWIDAFLAEVKNKGGNTDRILCYHVVLDRHGHHKAKADPQFHGWQQDAETLLLPVAHPRLHANFPLDLVKYERLLSADPRTIIVHDLYEFPVAGTMFPTQGMMEELVRLWELHFPDRIISCREAVAYVAKTTAASLATA